MAQRVTLHDGVGWLPDYTAKPWTKLIGSRWLHQAELRGVGSATMAIEEYGKIGMAWLVAVMAGHGCLLGA